MKIFVNKRKVLIIAPLRADDKFVSKYLNTNSFHDFFRKQWKPISNDSTLPCFLASLPFSWQSNLH